MKLSWWKNLAPKIKTGMSWKSFITDKTAKDTEMSEF